jgi:hypothetical protein
VNRKNKGFRNKDPRYFDKLRDQKRSLRNFFTKESVKKLGKTLKWTLEKEIDKGLKRD